MKNSWRLPTVAARDQKLVCAGPYKIFRHPIYFFVLGTNLALALCLPGPMTAALVLISVPVFRHFAIVEEAWMRQRFGDEYERYMERVPRWGLSWPKSRPGS
jgi:protein-S-isoprenylcysteine O-methyltransferase Ste14